MAACTGREPAREPRCGARLGTACTIDNLQLRRANVTLEADKAERDNQIKALKRENAIKKQA
jgi:hypothetical protein